MREEEGISTNSSMTERMRTDQKAKSFLGILSRKIKTCKKEWSRGYKSVARPRVFGGGGGPAFFNRGGKTWSSPFSVPGDAVTLPPKDVRKGVKKFPAQIMGGGPTIDSVRNSENISREEMRQSIYHKLRNRNLKRSRTSCCLPALKRRESCGRFHYR